MSLFVGHKIEQGEIGRVHHENVTKVTGDREITENTIRELAKTKLMPELVKLNTDNRRNFNLMQGYSLTSAKCQAAIDLINDNNLIDVVQDEENLHEQSGLHVFVWEKIKYISAQQVVGVAVDEQMIAATKGGALPYPCIDISKSAYEAMNRYVEVLKEQETRTRTYHTVSYSASSDSLSLDNSSYIRPLNLSSNNPRPRPQSNRNCSICTLL